MNNKKVYFEAGAHDGSFQSRTYSLKDNPDYFGILVEPSLDTYTQCVANRGNTNTKIYNCALVSNEYTSDTVKLFPCPHHSAMNITEASVLKHSDYPSVYSQTPIEVPARTIQSVLDENNITVVENMYLDLEGAEIPVLKGINFEKTTINFLEIETHVWVKEEITVEQEIEYYTEILQNNMKLDQVIRDQGHPKAVFVLKK